MAGFQKQVDEFILSMNRAAEAAAPLAARYFGDAIRAMTLQDVRGILTGGDTAATDFDLDDYVTNKALDGLFTMVGEEEKKIRTNPAARTTDLLRTVFGK